MRTNAILVMLALAACGGDEPPSCQQAIEHFYGVGCTFINTTTNPPSATPQAEAMNACTQINIQIPERCRDRFDDWKFCLADVADDTKCADCSQESDALFACD